MYCVMNFHVFVCSACAGIHREMTHKVKGISMCVFNEQELKDLADNGNAVSVSPSLTLTYAEKLFPLLSITLEPTSQDHEELEAKEQPFAREV